MKVLFVEDSEFYLHFRRGFFARLGARILNARSASLAVETIDEEKPDLVVVASRLPDSTGPDLCRLIREVYRERAPRLILMGEAGDAGPGAVAWDERVVRPVDPDDLMARISKILGVKERGSPRVAVRVQVVYGSKRDPLTGVSQNLSPDGMFIETDASLAAGTRVELEFSLPGQSRQLRTAADVMRCVRVGGGGKFGLGVRFVDPEPALRESIRAYLG